jgi:hypothetical protein
MEAANHSGELLRFKSQAAYFLLYRNNQGLARLGAGL